MPRLVVLVCLLVPTLAQDDPARLVEACHEGDPARVRALLAHGADVNARARDGATALFAAAGAGRRPPDQLVDFYLYAVRRLETVQLLLSAGADPNGPADGPPPLAGALEAGLLPVAEALLRAGASFDRAFDGTTLGAVALRETMKDGNAEMLDFLLRHGAKPDREVLWKAVEKNRSALVLRFLRAGADASGLFGPSYNRAPLLHHAAELGNALLVDALLRAGADVNAVDNDGDTALDVAVRRSGNSRPLVLPGAPDWANASNLAGYERSSRNYTAVARVLVAAGAKTEAPPAPPPGFVGFLHALSTELGNRDFRAFAARTRSPDGACDPDALLAHPAFDPVLLPSLAGMRSAVDLTLETHALWSRGVCPRGVPQVVADGDRVSVRAGRFTLRFERVDGHWTIPVPPLSVLDEALTRRKPDARTLLREFRQLDGAGYHAAAVARGRALLALGEESGLKRHDRFLVTWAIANAQVHLGDFAAAGKTLDAADALADESFRWLPLESRVAIACFMGDMKRARALAERLRAELATALANFDSDDRGLRSRVAARLAQAYANVGAALTMAGRHDEARAVLEEARTAVTRAEGAGGRTGLLVSMQLANLYGLTGQTESALSAYTAVLEELERGTGPLTPLAVQVHANLAALHRSAGDADAARRHIDEALEIGRTVYGPEHADYGLLLVQRGGLLLARGEFAPAAASYEEARRILALGDSGNLALAVLGLAACRVAEARPDAAEPLLDEAQRLVGETAGAAHRNMAQVHLLRAAVEKRRGHLAAAEDLLRRAVGIVEAERGRFRNDFDRRRYLGMVASYYGALGSCCLDAGEPERAFEAVERHKAKSLLELLAARPFRPRRGAEGVARLEALDARARPRRDLARLEGGARGGAFAIGSAKSIDTERHEVLQRLRKLDPEIAELVTVTWPGVADVQAVLEPGTRLVEYHVLGGSGLPGAPPAAVVAFVIGPDRFAAHRLAVPPDRLDATAATFARAVSDREAPLAEVTRLGRELYEQLLHPLDAELEGADTLVVVPYAKLHYVPFGALHTGDAYLTDRYRIVRVPSAGVYRTLRTRARPATHGLLALADPASYLSRLPGARDEVEEIRKHFDRAAVFVGEEATEAVLAKLERPPAVFHFAGHGVFERRAPELSHLALAPGGGDDGRLEVHEIHGLDFTGTRLVVLSACQGATGELGGGDEMVGLVRPFLATGAAAVVASLWNVDDRATARWMGGFYASLAQGAPVAEAVRAGRAAVRRSSLYRHPYFWAAFQLYGAPR